MPQLAQAPAKASVNRLVKLVAACACIAALAGCASKGSVLDELGTDSTIVTGATKPGTSGDVAQDEQTIRNAVTSADMNQISAGIPWANSVTGSTGTISTVGEYREKGVLCRRFTVSRESYNGVALFRGDVCLGDRGQWWTRSFETI